MNHFSKIYQKVNSKPYTQFVVRSVALGIVLAGVIIFFGTYAGFISVSRYSNSLHTSGGLVNPAVQLIEQEDLLVDFQGLRESLQEHYENRRDYMVSIYFEYLPTGSNISVNKDEKIWPASLIKVPVAMSAMKKVQDGTWKLSNELVILDDDKDSEYGILYKEPTGTTLSIRRFLEESLVNSDNTAHFVLLRNLDGSELEDVYNHLGLDDIIDALKKSPKGNDEVDNRITAKRYSVFFRSLYNATYLNPEYSQLFLDFLSRSSRELLGKGLPDDIPFAHKTGVRVDDGVRADSGIVYAPGRPYVLTVMVQSKNKKNTPEEVDKIFEDISREVYTYVTKIR